MAISTDAVHGSVGPRIMKLHGSIQGHDMVILVDSGSSSSFLSHSFAAQLSGIRSLPSGISVQVANGTVLHCQSVLPQASWSVGQYTFSSDLCILPLHHFDMILGMDWIESFSPMKVHWQHKWMVIPYHGSSAFLQGDCQSIAEDVVVHL